MNLRHRRFVALACGILISGPVSCPVTQRGTTVSSVTYSDVLERAFQFSRGLPAEFAEADHRVVLRILPSAGLESQVVIYTSREHIRRVIHYRLKQGRPSISEAYTKALNKDPAATVDEILRGISIERFDGRITDAEASLVERLFGLSIATKLDPSICTDGTTYQLWMQTPSNRIEASLSDCAYGEGTESTPLFQWIKAMRSLFEKAN